MPYLWAKPKLMAKKVCFNLSIYPDKENALILLRFNFKAKRFQISTGFSVPLKYWNKTAQRCKEVAAFPFAKQINARLNSLEKDTLKLFYDYAAEGIIPTIDHFKRDWEARVMKVEEEAPALIPFIMQVIEERKAMNRPKGSIQIYNNCLGHLEAYQKNKGKTLNFETLTQGFVNDFTAYLFSKGFQDSYSHKVISTLKTFVRLADSRGIFENSPLLKAKAEVRKREADKVYLNEGELRILANMPLEGKLSNVRDLFLIGCLTGLRFSDWSQIKTENIEQIEHAGNKAECIVMTTQKTKQKVILPLTNPMLRAILEKHGWKAPKRISIQRFNDYVKELCREAGFTQTIEINEYRAGRQEKQISQKWELIASHTARRSFATNAFKAGLPPSDIMKFTGHTTIASFMKYLKVTTEETAVILSEHEFFTGKPTLKVVG
jgi:site-specific recombinase XerD